MINSLVYLLCTLTSMACAALLLRGFYRTRTRLLFWSAFCFVGLALNNLLLFIDLAVLPADDIWGSFWRNLIGAASGSLLLFGLVWEHS